MDIELEGSNEYPAHYKVMMGKLNEQRQLDQFTDITLIVDGNFAYAICHLYDVIVKFPFIASFFIFSIFQGTSSGPIKQCWQHAVSFSISSSRILTKSHWWR